MAKERGVEFKATSADEWADEVRDRNSKPSGRCTRCANGNFTNTTTLKSLVATGYWNCPCRGKIRYEHRLDEIVQKALELDLGIVDASEELLEMLREEGFGYKPLLRCFRSGCELPKQRNMTVQDICLHGRGGSGVRCHPCPCRLSAEKGARAKVMALELKRFFEGKYVVEAERRVAVTVAVKRTLPTDVVLCSMEGKPILAVEFDGFQHTDADAACFGSQPSAGERSEVFEKRVAYDRDKDLTYRRNGVSTLHVHQVDYRQGVDIVVLAMKLAATGVIFNAVTSPRRYAAVIPDPWKPEMKMYLSSPPSFVPAKWN